MLRILSIGLEPALLAERNRVLVQRGFVVRGAATRTGTAEAGPPKFLPPSDK